MVEFISIPVFIYDEETDAFKSSRVKMNLNGISDISKAEDGPDGAKIAINMINGNRYYSKIDINDLNMVIPSQTVLA